MNLDALWSIEYATNHGDFGTGVAVLVGGRIYGGDTNFCYEGSYQCQSGEIRGRLLLRLHSGKPAPACLQGDRMAVLVRGEPGREEFEVTGVLEHEPQTKLFIHLTRQSSVPALQDGSPQVADDAAETDELVSEPAGGACGFLIGESSGRMPII